MARLLANWYATDKLYESMNSVVYRGHRVGETEPLILKILADPYPNSERVAAFKREFDLLAALQLPGVIGAYGLELDQQHWIMALEDFGGQALAQLDLAGHLPIDEFLRLALRITACLAQIHPRIIHKDLNPTNIVLNPHTGQVKLIDFGIATHLAQETPTFGAPGSIEGTLAYLSPEQTGRMNRAVDYRTDFYSLGVTFYELLTGRLPFETQDVLELIHAHMAKSPPPLHTFRPDIPGPVNDIVLKLLAKNAEDRYQSAYGLQADLEECLRQWQTGTTMASFALGGQDVAEQLQLPQKLYGREDEIATLLVACAEAGAGQRQLLLVAGHGGVGKTALVQEVYRPLTEQRGYFISGKFDQLRRDMPYSAIITAFGGLLRQLLAESDTALAAWQAQLRAALEPNAAILTTVIPELRLLLGDPPPVPDLDAGPAQNRFNLVFQSFLQVFATADHPLVMFLDDLQWADSASLKLLQWMLTAASTSHLLILGAYRETEVDVAHPLTQVIAEVGKAGTPVGQINLPPLALDHIGAFLADTLQTAPAAVEPLAGLLQAKTGGNPFFLGEFLRALYAERLLLRDSLRGGWTWDLDQIRARDITDNVIDLLAGNIRQLGAETGRVVRLAACIGNRFDLATLAQVADQAPHVAAATLWPALAERIIVPVGDSYLIAGQIEDLEMAAGVQYRFAHDRVQQAAYSLIDPTERQAAHLQVGRRLLQTTPPAALDQHLFAVVHQLNLGRTLIGDQAERDTLAALNLRAGRRAKAAAAYGPAFGYLTTGIELLGDDGWQRRYDLALPLHADAVEAALLSGRAAEMEALAATLLAEARTALDKVPVYEVKIAAALSRVQVAEAFGLGGQILALLGSPLPSATGPDDFARALRRTRALLAGKRIEDLADLPPMTDPQALATMRVLRAILPAAYVAQPAFHRLLVLQQVALSLRYGNTVFSPDGYSSYGQILTHLLGQIQAGYAFGQLSLDLTDKLDARPVRASTSMGFYSFLAYGKDHLRSTLSPLLVGHQSGLETGDLIFGAYNAVVYCWHLLHLGISLPEVEREIVAYSDAHGRIKQMAGRFYLQIYRQVIHNLMGRTADPLRLVGEAYDETAMLPVHQAGRQFLAVFDVHYYKGLLAYLFGEPAQALEHFAAARPFQASAFGFIVTVLIDVYESLARLAVWPTLPADEQAAALAQVAKTQKTLKRWAQHAPQNFMHRYYLVEAERARVLGRAGQARQYYDQAIDLARTHGWVNDEALAYERAAGFYEDHGPPHLAEYYLRAAHQAYRGWGAQGKVRALEARRPGLASVGRGEWTLPNNLTLAVNRTPTHSVGGLLDTTSVIRAAQALSREIALDRLLTRLMTLVLETAGAQTGYLLLDRQGRWMVEATGTTDPAEVQVLQGLPLAPMGEPPLLPLNVIQYVARTQDSVVLDDAGHDGAFGADPTLQARHARSVLCTPLLNQGRVVGLLYLENNLTPGAFTADRLEVLHLLSAQAAISITNASLYSDLATALTRQVSLTKSYSRFVPEEILRFLGKDSIVDVQLGDQTQQDMTILFSDIRSFTSLSEAMTPQESFNFINAYLRRVGPVIRNHQGFIDKYIGDAVMALFPGSAEHAMRAALAMTHAVDLYNAHRRQRNYPPIAIGIGVHSGPLMLGTIGEEARMEGTVISDTVNLAERLEGLTKRYGSAILISAHTLACLEQPLPYQVRFLGRVRVKGKLKRVGIFEILDAEPLAVRTLKLQTAADFRQGLRAYYRREWAAAAVCFERVLAIHPEDRAARYYLRVLQRRMHLPVPGGVL